MANTKSRWLDDERAYRGERPAKALVAWLNAKQAGSWLHHRQHHRGVIEALLKDAQRVHKEMSKHSDHHALMVAMKANLVPTEFSESLARLNGQLSAFTHTPSIEPYDFYDGRPVSWVVTGGSPLAIVGQQVDWVLELVFQKAILKVRTCQQCGTWYFARFDHQAFCSEGCRLKRHASTESFKERRRQYMKDYYHLKKSGKVK